MNHLSSFTSTAEKDNQPPLILEDALKWLSEKEFDGCLQVVHNSVKKLWISNQQIIQYNQLN